MGPDMQSDVPQSSRNVSLTTIVVTRGRVPLLRRALNSLVNQRNTHTHLLVIVDDCTSTVHHLSTAFQPAGAVCAVRWDEIKRQSGERSGPKRLASLRQLALSGVVTPWCSFLDDDNELEPDHCHSLLSCAEASEALAAHSWRRLFYRDGRPFPLLDRHPWCRDQRIARQLFMQYEAAGIYSRGSNTIRDRVVPRNRALSMVDMSEWIFRSSFIAEIGFVTRYSSTDWLYSRSEDSKLLDRVVELGIQVPSTQRATLRYYLGGYSNGWDSDGADIEGWL